MQNGLGIPHNWGAGGDPTTHKTMTRQEIAHAVQENYKMAEFFKARNAEGDAAKAQQCLQWNIRLLSTQPDDDTHFDNI